MTHADDLRPYSMASVRNVWLCEFCGQDCVDQTLISWEFCCTAFELAVERDELKAELARFVPFTRLLGLVPPTDLYERKEAS